jgi:hypothetical protein
VLRSKIYNPEDDYAYWEAYDALTKMKDDYLNFNILMEIYLTPRSDFAGTAKDILKIIHKEYKKNSINFDIKLATQILQASTDLMLRPFSSRAQTNVYDLADKVSSRPSYERMLQGVLIGLVGAALVATGLLIASTAAGATIPFIGAIMSIGFFIQYSAATALIVSGAGISYLAFGIFSSGMRQGLSKSLCELGELSDEVRDTHLIQNSIFGHNDQGREEIKVYYEPPPHATPKVASM